MFAVVTPAYAKTKVGLSDADLQKWAMLAKAEKVISVQCVT